MHNLVAIDTETTGTDFFHGCKPYIVTACDGKRNYLWEGSVNPQTREVTWNYEEQLHLQNFINDCKKVIFHNTNFDVRALDTIQINLPQQVHEREDTLVASHVVCSGDKHGLKPLSIKYLSYFEDDKEDLKDSIVEIRTYLRHKNPNNIAYAQKGHPHFPASDASWAQDMWLDMDKAKKYACGDVERTWLLWGVFEQYLLEHSLMDQYRFRMQILPILYDMQTVGIHVYKDKLLRLKNELTIQLQQLKHLIRSSSDCPYEIVPSKPEDLRLLLYTILKLTPPSYTDTGLTSTDEGALNKLEKENDELDTIRYLKGWRKANKTLTDITAYEKWCDDDNRLHSTLNLTGTHWTRQTSKDPNQQNFNKKLKFLFGPKKGYYWLYADIVNIELRIWAYDCNAKDLIDAFERGDSVHIIIAKALYPDLIKRIGIDAFKETKTYTKCKGGTFARIYGGSDKKVNDTYGVAGACAIIDAKLPEVGEYFKTLESIIRANEEIHGYPRIYTLQGYPLDVPISKPYTAGSGRIQGSAGMIVQDMMLQLYHSHVYKNPLQLPLTPPPELRCQLIQQVHDSLTLEIPCHSHSTRTNAELISIMEETGQKHIPTCPMDYEVIECQEEREPEFRDYTFIPKVQSGYEIEMYMQNHQYKGVAVYDKDNLITKFGKTKEEVLHLISKDIENEDN